MSEHGPQQLSDVLSKLISLRGYARKQADAQLQTAWAAVAGEAWAAKTRATAIKRGVVQVSVTNSPLLSELDAFHKKSLLGKFQKEHPHLRVRDIKFRLDGNLRPNTSSGE